MMISRWHHVATMPLARERRRRFRSQEPHLRVGHIDTTFWNHRPNRTNKIGFKTLTSRVITILLSVLNSRMLYFICHPYRHLHSLPYNISSKEDNIKTKFPQLWYHPSNWYNDITTTSLLKPHHLTTCNHCNYHRYFITKVWATGAHKSALCRREHWPMCTLAYLFDTLVTGMPVTTHRALTQRN